MNAIEIKGWQKDATIAAIVKATFPDYRRQKVYVRACESVTLSDLNWSGGTRSEYRACKVNGEFIGSADRFHQYAPWDARQVEGLQVPRTARRDHCPRQSFLRQGVHPDLARQSGGYAEISPAILTTNP